MPSWAALLCNGSGSMTDGQSRPGSIRSLTIKLLWFLKEARRYLLCMHIYFFLLFNPAYSFSVLFTAVMHRGPINGWEEPEGLNELPEAVRPYPAEAKSSSATWTTSAKTPIKSDVKLITIKSYYSPSSLHISERGNKKKKTSRRPLKELIVTWCL